MSIILGGGLSGLSVAYYLVEESIRRNKSFKYVLLEASSRCGGWVKSLCSNDYVFEQGPRTIRPKGPAGINTLNLLEQLNLEDQVCPISEDHPAARNRMIYVNNTLHPLPSSIASMFQKNSPFSKPLIFSLLNEIKQPQEKLVDDTMYNFVERRFGKELADYGISPMICGICAGDAKEISVKFLLKELFEWEQVHGSVTKGLLKSWFDQKKEEDTNICNLAKRAKEEKWSVYTLQGGLEKFPMALESYLKHRNIEFQYDSCIKNIEFISPGVVEVTKSTGLKLRGQHVYSSIPAYALAELVKKQHSQLADLLEKIPFVTVGIVNLYYTQQGLTTPAFGFLVPPKEKSPILGVVYDSCCIPNQNGTVLTVMLGGRWFEKFGDSVTEEYLYEVAKREIASILNIKHEPDACHVNILKNCIPQYIVGHYDRVNEIRSYIQEKKLDLTVVGCSYDGVGINDVIYSSKKQVTPEESIVNKTVNPETIDYKTVS